MDISQLLLEKSVVNGVKVMKKSFCRLCSCWSEIHGGTTPKNASVTMPDHDNPLRPHCPARESRSKMRTLPCEKNVNTAARAEI